MFGRDGVEMVGLLVEKVKLKKLRRSSAGKFAGLLANLE